MTRIVAEFHVPGADEYREPAQVHGGTPEGDHPYWRAVATLGRFAIYNKVGRGMAATAALVGITFSNWVSEQDGLPSGPDNCTDPGHAQVEIGNTSHYPGLSVIGLDGVAKSSLRGAANTLSFGHLARDNMSWGGLAAKATAERGYDISAQSLAADNQAIAKYSGGNLEDHISYAGAACLALPGPEVPGIVAVNGKNTVAIYAGDSLVSMKELVKLNPGLTGDPSQVLSKGRVLKTGTPDLTLFKRDMTEPNLYTVDHGNPALGRKIRDSNPASIGITQGSHLLLPPVPTKWMEQHHVSVADIQSQYQHSYDHLGVSQTITPKENKPVIPEHKPSVAAGTLEAFQLERYGVPSKYAKMYVEYGHKYNVPPAILAGEGKQESGWQQDPGVSSTGARGISQFEPGTWAEVKAKLKFPTHASPMQPRYAIEAQAAYMQELMAGVQQYAGKHSVIELALAAYNLGPGKVDKYRGMPPPDLIGNYVTNITSISHNINTVFPVLKPTDKFHETSTGQKVPEAVRGAAYFSQTDNRWAWSRYNTGHNSNYTVGLNGCQPAQASILFSTLSGKKITPVDMANFNMTHKYILPDALSGGTDGEAAIYGAANSFGFKVTPFAKQLTDDMKKFLDHGGMIAVSAQDNDPNTPATPGGHDYVIDGYTPDGRLHILDPASIHNTLKSWSPQQIFGPAGFVLGVSK